MRGIISALTLAALIGGMPAASVFAQSSGLRSADAVVPTRLTRSEGAVEQAAQAGSRLRVGMLKLVAEAKAGGSRPAPPPPQQPAQSNSLSRGQKTALVAGAAAAVIILLIVISRRGGSDRVVAPPCPPGQLCL